MSGEERIRSLVYVSEWKESDRAEGDEEKGWRK